MTEFSFPYMDGSPKGEGGVVDDSPSCRSGLVGPPFIFQTQFYI